MKKTFPFLLLMFAFISCCKEHEDASELDDGTIIGIDYRECASPYCGGWFIEVGGDTLRFLEVPGKTDIDFSSELDFPLPVELSWHKYGNDWSSIQDLIKVEEIWKD
ncbi:MAG: hypothetical protein EPO28_10595 [Saprospiraceae bacterium]|nr:MAG: hypothetical protein EPO28_10595 [Saprospiraceae bacterium]